MARIKWTVLRDIDRIHIDRQQREGGYVMPAHHYHPYYELCCIEQGSCRFQLEDRSYDLHTGDALLIPPQLLHDTSYPFGACRRIGCRQA
jgi:mannose-6-phosphate isomerase-like protein (cupin superfamily)